MLVNKRVSPSTRKSSIALSLRLAESKDVCNDGRRQCDHREPWFGQGCQAGRDLSQVYSRHFSLCLSKYWSSPADCVTNITVTKKYIAPTCVYALTMGPCPWPTPLGPIPWPWLRPRWNKRGPLITFSDPPLPFPGCVLGPFSFHT